MNYETLRQEFKEKGFAIVRGLLSKDEVESYIQRMEKLSGISRGDFSSVSGRGFDQSGKQTSWNLPDGVAKTEEFWPIIFNERLLTTVRELLGPDIRFLQHNDLHVGFSAISWHRDSVNRKFGQGPDWNETEAAYKLVRVAIYLQSYEESQFRLGFINSSHQPTPTVTLKRRIDEAKLNWFGALSYVSPKLQMWASNAEWIATEPGDCLIFDPRALHSGSYITGPKYSMFVAYGQENEHFYNHQNYYNNIRTELGYQPMNPELAERLKEANLLPENVPVYDKIEGAWVPAPILKNLLAQRLNKS